MRQRPTAYPADVCDREYFESLRAGGPVSPALLGVFAAVCVGALLILLG
jgi:hypothetical protein